MIHFSRFKKSYGRHTVLEIPDLTLSTGVYWVRGANGTGKSTLLKSVAGLLFFNGDIHLREISLKKHPVAYRKKVNFGDAEPVFPGFLTGTEMIALFKKAKGNDPQQDALFIDQMNMGHYLNNPISTYSSGMLKKLSLLLAFMGNPEVILLDEPLITIDTASLDAIYNWITTSYRDKNTTFLLSSHQTPDRNLLPDAVELYLSGQSLRFSS